MLENIEALTQDENNDFKYKMEKDECKITFTENAWALVVGASGLSAQVEYNSKGEKVKINLTDATQLYSLGGSLRLGEDKTCNDVCKEVGITS